MLFNLKGMFTNVVARWPGSTHDSHVFRTSNICTYLQSSHRSLNDGVLLGDSGYTCSPFLMTPYTTTRSAAQEAYNDAHTKTRVVIKQTFGRWKRRFHVHIRLLPLAGKYPIRMMASFLGTVGYPNYFKSGDQAKKRRLSCLCHFGTCVSTRKSLHDCRRLCSVAQHCFTATQADGG